MTNPHIHDRYPSQGKVPIGAEGVCGFTLIELLVYMGLLGIFLVTITTVFTAILSARLETSAYGSVSVDSHYLMRRMGYDMQRATSIVLPASYGVAGNSCRVVTPEGTLQYTLSGTNLTLQRGVNTYVLNTTGTAVQAFQVTKTKKGLYDALNIHLVLASNTKTDSAQKTRTLDLVYAIR